jgi:PIN domain nuclease of toxin-antitoxin system
MNEVVLDASAILAIIFHERGAEKLTDEILDHAVVSTVNLAEVQSKLIKKGYEPEEAWEDALSFVAAAELFTEKQAKIAGDLITKTEKFGLSLGDRSCLALAIALKAPVYTTEQIWRNLKVGVPIHVIR